MIDDAKIKAYINCQHKVYLLLNYPQEANNSVFNNLEPLIVADIQRKYIQENSLIFGQNIDIQLIKPASGPQFISSCFFKNDEFNLHFHALSIGKNTITPHEITIFENPSREEKLKACFKAFVIKAHTKNEITEIAFIRNNSLKITKIKTAPFFNDFKDILEGIRDLRGGVKTTKPSIKPHCQICQFQLYCKKQLIEREDLSLLSGLRSKEISKKQAKGIFSITQLAYTFSPQRKLYSKKKFLPELKALAIREKKTYVVKFPEFDQAVVQVFLDIEGTPDNRNYYLIGCVIKNGVDIILSSYWKVNGEDKIFQHFFDLISKFQEFKVYHYGTYEITALKAQRKIVEGTPYQNILEKILKNSINVLDEFLARVYPPTFTNSLKDIASFLGFEWKEPDINGYKSIFWRKYWEVSNEFSVKEKLIRYNIEDCQALASIVNWLILLSHENKLDGTISQVADIKKQSAFKFGDSGYVLKEFKEINSYAYFNYQRDKIYLKTNKNLKRTIINKPKKSKEYPNKVIESIKPEICIYCGGRKIYKNGRNRNRKTFDLIFGKSSIKRSIILHEQAPFRCRDCEKVFFNNYASENPKYGWNLRVWCVNNIISYNMSLTNVSNLLKNQFDIKVATSYILRFKRLLADYYKGTVENIKKTIIAGNLLQVDETQIEIKDIKGKCYVWVFTTIDSVFYLFRENREADFLVEMLRDFKGVLISDFYAAYDSIDSPQQKCLVHLIRDLNDDLIKNPFNLEYQLLVQNFAFLLKNITDTINIYGLKKRNLNKHKKEVSQFFDKVLSEKFQTEIAIFYQKKFRKYKNKLFTFLEYDSIPWNNNNAEVAVKPFAIHRNNMNSLHTQKGIEEYLILLSIRQTCKYQNLSFWEFLKSKRTTL
ncbi:MAG: TM0106 family RecB-like putative nuclease [Spirosoma sp.]|nr:TM0106 family RecB-like putative nuclease [Spirosoma sp.]